MNTIIEKIRAEVERLQHTDIPHTDEWWDGADYVRRRMKEVLSDLEKVCPRLQDDQIIQKAKSEKQRVLITETDGSANVYWDARSLDDVKSMLNSALAFIGEQSEKQTTAEGLEEEYKDYVESDPVYGKLVNRNAGLSIARHFAQWGAEHAREQRKPKPSEELETEALRSAGVLLSEHFEDEDDDAIRTTALRCWKGGVIHGASWQKEQMMKEAVEGEVCGRVYDHINVRFADGICNFLEPKNISHIPADVSKYNIGDKVRIIIVKEDK